MQAMLFGLNHSPLEITTAQPAIQGLIFIGPVTGPVLIHKIEIGIRGDFPSYERENLVGTG